MSVQKVSCASCGASIQVPADIDRLNCSYCGSTLVIQRGEGYIATKLAEQLGAVIQNTSAETQSAIREGNQAIQAELKRLRLNQEITTAYQQLNRIQEEIQARKAIKGNRQNYLRLVELQKTEAQLLDDIAELEDELSPPDPQPESEPEPEARRGSSLAYNLPAIVVILLGLGCLCYLMFGLEVNTTTRLMPTTRLRRLHLLDTDQSRRPPCQNELARCRADAGARHRPVVASPAGGCAK